MKRILGTVLASLLLAAGACNNDAQTKRVAQLEAEIAHLRAHAQTTPVQQTAVANAPTEHAPASSTPLASTESVQPAPRNIPVVEGQSVTTRVNYAESWKGVDKEFYFVDSYVTDAHFPPEKGVKASVILVPLHFHTGEGLISTEEAQDRLAAQGFRPATIRELRAFARANPDYQKRFLVVALGSSWIHPSGSRGMPCLVTEGSLRELSLCWTYNGWGSDWQFLAVRKPAEVPQRGTPAALSKPAIVPAGAGIEVK